MNLLCVKLEVQDGKYFVDPKTLTIISAYKLACASQLSLKVALTKTKNNFIEISLEDIDYAEISDAHELSTLSEWPIILLDSYIVSGFCAVARQICRLSSRESIQKLLGFREACLVACAETSVWTKFCEIDITNTISNILTSGGGNNFHMPEDVLRFENHLSQPVRIHNIYKLARKIQNDKALNSSTPRSELEVHHDYAEGPYLTLADLILYPSFEIFFQFCQHNDLSIQHILPLTCRWFKRVHQQCYVLPKFNIHFNKSQKQANDRMIIIVPKVSNVSLYKADPIRNVSAKHHTKQYKIEFALNLVDCLKQWIINNIKPVGFNNSLFDWGAVPLEANPQGGALPASRANRKCEQLENLVKATLEIVGEKKYRIVDFCSGSGHLGILIALVMPHCQVILVENKEVSLARARDTILKLKLTNLVLVQSNLDYFTGRFDLGIALHACGLATDLVIQQCIKNQADFICCPCCYGAIKNCHEMSYPRSQKFKRIFLGNEDHYFNLAHAADQTHGEENVKTKQGYFCMDIVDSDRRLYAEERGYDVHLGKLIPQSCTNKNNLLVGRFVQKKLD